MGSHLSHSKFIPIWKDLKSMFGDEWGFVKSKN
jgi:hypothetical protein